jgi:hypothetical protein
MTKPFYKFYLLRTDVKKDENVWLPELKTVDHIRLTDFELTLEMKQQLTMDDFDWLHILGITIFMIVFPILVLIMYKIHLGIQQRNYLKRKRFYQLAKFYRLTGLVNYFHF